MDWLFWLGAIFGIGILIMVHEAGHYLVAKWCNMRVERFSIGFGPAVASWEYKGTLFQLAPIPFGGFVEIRGMNIAEDVDPDDPYAYPNRPAWQRFATIFAGPGTNYLFAVLLAFLLYGVAGVPTVRWYEVDNVNEGFDAYGKLEPGDRILSIQRAGDPEPVPVYFTYGYQPVPAPLGSLVHGTGGEPFNITVKRGDEQHTFAVAAREDPDLVHQQTGEAQYRLGIEMTFVLERADVGVGEAAVAALAFPIHQTKQSLSDLYKIIVGEEEGQLAGPVGITRAIKQAIEDGWIIAVERLVLFNVLIGLFNLLPVPALDGGRLVFLIYEMATRRRANPKIESTVHMVGIMILLVVMIAVTVKECAEFF